jgi:hypothetical protein
MDERYFGMINDEISLRECQPIFKDVTAVLRNNPGMTIDGLVSELLKDEGLDKEEFALKRNIQDYMSSAMSHKENGLVMRIVDLSNVNIAELENSKYDYRAVELNGAKTQIITDYKNIRAMPLFQDAKYTDPETKRDVGYKGLYIVISKIQQGGFDGKIRA